MMVGVFAGIAPVFALDPAKSIAQYVHRSWAVDDGLPQSSVSEIVQTDDGYIWVGTRDGLARFDGARFTVFRRLNTPALLSNNITALAKGRDNVLWIGTTMGLVRYANGEFVSFSPQDGLLNDYITSILPDAEGRVWVGTGLGLVRSTVGPQTRFVPVPGAPTGGMLFARLLDKQGTIWFTTPRLYRLVGETAQPVEVSDGLRTPTVNSAYQDRAGAVWFGTSAGIYRLQNGRIGLYARTPGPVMRMLVDADGSLWATLDSAGLARLRAGQWEKFTAEDGLSSDAAGPLYQDREQNLWIGTTGGGLDGFSVGKFTSFGLPEGLPSDTTHATLQDRRGNIWVGTRTGVTRLGPDGRTTSFSVRQGLSSYRSIRSPKAPTEASGSARPKAWTGSAMNEC
jgi:ligand-binding sensor domain-containing protein